MRKILIVVAFGVVLLSPVLVVAHPSGSRDSSTPPLCQGGFDCAYFPIALSDGAIYYRSSLTEIRALNAETGQVLWTYSLPTPFLASNLVALGSRIYFTIQSNAPCGPLFALGARTHKIEWSKDYDSCSIWSDGKLLYLQGGQGDGDGLIAVDPLTAKEVWNAEGVTQKFVKTLIVRDGRLYTNDRVLDAKTGKTLHWWPKEYDISVVTATNSVVVVGGDIGGLNGVVTGYNANTLKKEWETTIFVGKEIVATLSANNLVYVVGYSGDETSSRDGVLRAFDINTGRLEWSYQIHSCCQILDTAPLSIGKNALYLVEPSDSKTGSKLVALDTTTGRSLWSFQSAATLEGPAYPHGSLVYVASPNNGVIALNAGSGKIVWVYKAQ